MQAIRQSTFGEMKSLAMLLKIRAAALRIHDTGLSQDQRILDAFSTSILSARAFLDVSLPLPCLYPHNLYDAPLSNLTVLVKVRMSQIDSAATSEKRCLCARPDPPFWSSRYNHRRNLPGLDTVRPADCEHSSHDPEPHNE